MLNERDEKTLVVGIENAIKQTFKAEFALMYAAKSTQIHKSNDNN